MSPTRLIQPTFAGGEFAPSLYSRVDLQKYSSGLRIAKNFFIHPHGGASNRPGTEYIATTKTVAEASRLVPFEFSSDQAYVLEFGKNYIRFFMDGGAIVPDPDILLDYSPGSYPTGDWVKMGGYISLNTLTTKYIYVNAPYGGSVADVLVQVTTAINDTLTVTVSGTTTKTILISLANSTATNNTAAKIQTALRLLADYSTWVVTANAAYASTPSTAGVALAATAMTAQNKFYYCIADAVSTDFPVIETSHWTEKAVYEVITTYAEADIADLKFAQSADTLYICHPDYAPMTLVRYDHADWELSAYAYEGGPFMLSNAGTTTMTVSALTGTGKTLTASANTFDTSSPSEHIGSIWRITHQMANQTTCDSKNTADACSGEITGKTWRLITSGTWTGTLHIERFNDAGSYEVIRSIHSNADINANIYGEHDDIKVMRLRLDSAWGGGGTVYYAFSCDPYEHTGIVEITAVASATSATVSILDSVGATSATTEWAEGSWSTYRGFPSCAVFYQDRLCFAATPTEPQTVWMTETGNYLSFDRSDPLVDSDGISVNLASRKMNGIKSMITLNEILTLTAGSEWSVGPSSTGIITPTSVDTRCNGYRGSNGVDPVLIGNRAIYIQPMGSVIVDIGWDTDSSGYTGAELSIMSNHLFTNHDIIAMAFQKEPDSLVWCVRDDGVLLSMTYMREHDVIAWTRHETDGDVESICCIPGEDYDELWMIVKRGTNRFIERMAQRMVSTDTRKQFFVDSGLSLDDPKTITGATAANPVVITSVAHGFSNGDLVDILEVEGMTELNGCRFKVANKADDTFEITDEDDVDIDGTAYTAYVSGGEVRECAAAGTLAGFDHLIGETVAILADGCVQAKQVVDGSGQITLASAASIVHVGLPYICDIETLNIEMSLQSGSTQGRLLRVIKCIVRFLNSLGGWIGPDEDSLTEILQRTDEPMGSPVDLKTEDHEVVLASSYDTNGRLFYRQADPLPVTILGVIPVIEQPGE